MQAQSQAQGTGTGEGAYEVAVLAVDVSVLDVVQRGGEGTATLVTVEALVVVVGPLHLQTPARQQNEAREVEIGT